MNETNKITVWGFLRGFFGTVLAVVLILPLLVVAELICLPKWVSYWLWDLESKIIGGRVD